jgi:hypothetical protein
MWSRDGSMGGSSRVTPACAMVDLTCRGDAALLPSLDGPAAALLRTGHASRRGPHRHYTHHCQVPVVTDLAGAWVRAFDDGRLPARTAMAGPIAAIRTVDLRRATPGETLESHRLDPTERSKQP